MLNTVIFNDSELYVDNIQLIVTTFLTNIFTGASYVLIMMFLSWKLSLVAFIFVPFYAIWIIHISAKLGRLAEEQQISKDEFLKEVNNYSTNKEVIKIFHFFRMIVTGFNNAINENKKINVKVLTYQNFISIVSSVIVTLAAVVPFVVGITFIKGGDMSIGDLVAFNSYTSLLFSPVTQLIGIIATIRMANVYKSRIEFFNFQAEKEKFDDSSNIEEIKINNLSIFSEKKIILEDINFNITRGEWIRLRGANGSGKSLFLKVIANLYSDYKGEILINNDENSNLIGSRKIIYISNEHGFPMQNLFEEMMTESNANSKDIRKILKIVSLDDKVMSLKQGIYTKNNEIMEKFSTGELQKLRLARAIIRKPDFLFVDEILSNIELDKAIDILNKIHYNYPSLSLILVEHHFPNNELLKKEVVIENRTITTF
ncbi:ABC transporter ATP-binding protein [Enterococcus sp. CWB-B31]|uniref:ATP-binding cassette domain-containing protein n=1 Tax=Enterococcus sp. CWB-B31 TaxID=2885159 RepID=UPI001E484A8D|nr:ABC transporter ATP-binding protein [Enterococcus sp. CWB-B31]MCB5956478.1 ABC transporter ATP-binding protein/permease [Enterococcus sp. CWB-B31]